MTLEHKILTLIDRGVDSLDDVKSIAGVGKGIRVDNEIWRQIGIRTIELDHRGKSLFITPAGIERLNELDDARMCTGVC